jgi:hypothetical protein
MNRLIRTAAASALAVALFVAAAAPARAELDPRLAPLAPYVGRTYTAQVSPPGAARAAMDVQQWEEIMGGKAVRITHSINGGDYGGESLIFWDVSRETIAYWYVTTADFYTHGTMTAAGDSLVTLEQVVGNAGGISEVEGVWHRTADGHTVTSRMKAAGQWQPKRTSEYKETPGATPAFR